MKSSAHPETKPILAARGAHRSDSAIRTLQPRHSPAPLINCNIPWDIPATLATTPLKTISHRDPQPLKRLRSISHINIYSPPRCHTPNSQAQPPTNFSSPTHPYKHSNKKLDATGNETRAHRQQGTLSDATTTHRRPTCKPA